MQDKIEFFNVKIEIGEIPLGVIRLRKMSGIFTTCMQENSSHLKSFETLKNRVCCWFLLTGSLMVIVFFVVSAICQAKELNLDFQDAIQFLFTLGALVFINKRIDSWNMLLNAGIPHISHTHTHSLSLFFFYFSHSLCHTMLFPFYFPSLALFVILCSLIVSFFLIHKRTHLYSVNSLIWSIWDFYPH